MNTTTNSAKALLDAMNAAIDALTDERADDAYKADVVDLLRAEVGKLKARGTGADTSGPAFPTMERGGSGLELTGLGLSRREYFAAHAPDVPADFPWAESETDLEQRLVRWRLHYADAMLKALES